MPRVTDISLFKLPKQPALCVRKTTRVEELPMLIGQSYAGIAAYLEELGETLADIPFVGYHNMDMQNLEVEIGFPLAAPLPGRGDILAGAIPAGPAACCVFRGPYGEMGPVYAEMAQWIQDKGYAPAGIVYEHYYNGPDRPAGELLTKIVMLLQ